MEKVKFKYYNFKFVKGFYIQLWGIIYRAEKYQVVPKELRYNVVPHIKIFNWYLYKIDMRWQRKGTKK